MWGGIVKCVNLASDVQKVLISDVPLPVGKAVKAVVNKYTVS